MLWLPTIMVKIGVTIISTVNAIAIYGMIVVLEYAPVKWWLRRQSHVFRLCPKSMPSRCFSKNVAIVSWMGCYATIALIAKTMLLPKEKAWIGFPIIVIKAKQSDVYLNKPSPTGNGRDPSCMPMMSRKPCGLGMPFPMIIINSDFF